MFDRIILYNLGGEMFSLKNESKNIKTLFFAVLTMFFVLSIWSIFYYGDSTFLGSFEKYNNDDVKYIRSAKVLLNEGMFTYKKPDVSTVFIMPGLPLMTFNIILASLTICKTIDFIKLKRLHNR